MKKILIVLINDYPYNKGEPFFENEIIALSKAFNYIYLFSVVGKENEKPTRNVPSNVLYYPLGCNHNRLKYILKGIFSSDKKFNLNGKTNYRFFMSSYILGRNMEISKKIKAILDKQDLSKSTFYIYSYWLTLGIASYKIQQYLQRKTNTKIRTISRCHGYDTYSEVNKYNYQPFQSEVIGVLDNVYPCSEFGRKYLIDKYPEFKNKIVTSYLSSDNHGIGKYSFDAKKTKHFVTVAGFRPVKRMKLFAEAFVNLAKNRNDVFWDSFGSGEEYEDVRRYIENAGIIEKVKFYGNVSNSKIFDFYKKNEVYFFVNVSYSEGMPVSIMEAASFGIPIAATNVGGTSELVDNSNGVLINKDIDKNKLANVLDSICHIDKEKYLGMRIKSREKWDAKFNSTNSLPLWLDELTKK